MPQFVRQRARMGRLHCLSEAVAQGPFCRYTAIMGNELNRRVSVLQTFQSYMQFKEIPRKLIVAKRLSQCLNPALPTGVHQRALEVYTHILAVLGVREF